MRLISQDGIIDVPYDKCCLEVEASRREGSVVYFIYAHTNKVTLPLASYFSKSKALKVMEMLREQYFNNKHEETYRDGVFDYAPNFKFPDDSEIEV